MGTNLALAFLGVAAIGLVTPIFFTVRESNLELHSVAVHAATADSFKVGTPIRVFSKPDVVLEQGTVALTASNNGKARSFDAILALLKSGSADLVVSDATVTLDGGPLQREPGTEGASSAADMMVAPLVAVLTDMNFDGLTLRRSTLILKRSESGQDVFTDINAELSSMGRTALRAVGSFRYRGEPLTFDVTLNGAKGKSSGVRMPLRATLKGELVSAEIDGLLALGDQPQVVSSRSRLTIESLGKTARWLGFDWPVASPVERFQAQGKLDWSNRAIAFEAAHFDLDGNDASGTLSISLADKRPAIDATIAFGKLDVGRFEKKETSTLAAAQIPAPWNSLFTYSKSSSSVVAQIDSDIRLSADEIVGLPVRVGRSAATVTVKSGKLLADITELEIGSGSEGRGQVSWDVNGTEPSLEFNGQLDRLDYAIATTALIGFPAVHGLGSISADLSGSGSSVTEIQSSLSGKVDIALPTGGRLAGDIRTLAAQARANPAGDLQAPVWGQTQFEQLSARLIFSNGIATVSNFKATAGPDVLEASGRIALPARTIDMRLRAAPASTNTLALTKSLLEPDFVRVRGPWSKPAARATTGLASDSDGIPQVRPASQSSTPAGLLTEPPATTGAIERH